MMSNDRAISHIPGVIHRALLEKKAADQGLKLEQVQTLSLHSLKIFKIDHLWMFEKLTILKLNGNIIEKIENLDSLINLTELNLSFNKINKIENLEKLGKLEKLLLHSNKINKLEGLDSQENLQLLSISKNLLESLDDVIYLRRLRKLKALSLDGNPVNSVPDQMEYTVTFLPNLRYYDYKLITRNPESTNKYKQQLTKLEEEEQEQEANEKKEKENRRKQEVLEEAFVETLDVKELLSSLEQPIWSSVMQIGGETVTTIQHEYKEQMEKVCSKLQELGLTQLEVRCKELSQFKLCMDKACEDNRQEAMMCVRNFLAPKENMYSDIRKCLEDMEKKKSQGEDYSSDLDILKGMVVQFNEDIEVLWKSLMVLEIELQEQIEDVTHLFGESLAELVEGFIEQAKTLLLQACDLEEQFHERIKEPCTLQATNLRAQMQGTKTYLIDAGAIKLTRDPANLNSCLTECHEQRLQAIKQREDSLVTACRRWLNQLLADLNSDEFRRSRSRVLEINDFLDVQRKEISNLQPGSLASQGLL